MRSLIAGGLAAAVAMVIGGPAHADWVSQPTEPTILTFQMMSGLNYASAWDMTGLRDVPNGESFSSAVLAQSASAAYYIDNAPDTFTFGGAPQNGGSNVITGAATSVQSIQIGNDVIVAAFTNNSSDWLPSGVNSPTGLLTQLRMDNGTAAAGLDSIMYAGFSPADVLGIDVVLFKDGGAIFAGAIPGGNWDLSTGLAAVAVINGAAGVGIDEIQFVYHLSVPAPGTAGLLALAGLAATRRRR